MATSDSPQLEIKVAKPGDLTVEVIESKDGLSSDGRRVSFRVDKAKLMQFSQYFRRMFNPNSRWVEAESDKIILERDTIKAMEVWFALFHNALSKIPNDSVSVAEVWHIIMVSDKYEFDRKHLVAWFKDWCNWKMTNTVHSEDRMRLIRQLLFPCYSFNFAAGFQIITKELVYKSHGHITELNPTEHCQMHLPARVIQQLNAAKGRLRNVLHRGLFSDVAKTLRRSKCICEERSIFLYLRELQRIGVWPLEDLFPKVSIGGALGLLQNFDHTKVLPTVAAPVPTVSPETSNTTTMRSNHPYTQTLSCGHGSYNWDFVVEIARIKVENHFEGLCMDCMGSTRTFRFIRDENDDYIDRDNWGQRYDSMCRIKHNQTTCYFSVMARRENIGRFDRPADVSK